jgi:hypothetical protein
MGGSQPNKELCVGETSLNTSKKCEECRTQPLLEHHEESIVDSGCTGHLFLINGPFQKKVKSQIPLRV